MTHLWRIYVAATSGVCVGEATAGSGFRCHYMKRYDNVNNSGQLGWLIGNFDLDFFQNFKSILIKESGYFNNFGDDDEVYNNSNLHSKEQDELEIPDVMDFLVEIIN
ncbi:hypothetical protein RhiirA1_445317 [Rhizophagus irregularis]|uniref:Uncharacterized protein n=1 Tax=Rhizophagus irregularis TaxID=588596 RepID=A0A2N0R8S8_9GLOM|nr:hypothetical protein RhiirA1_445317 [Rhizophagus irregularis]